jgi:hypothetical protein
MPSAKSTGTTAFAESEFATQTAYETANILGSKTYAGVQAAGVFGQTSTGAAASKYEKTYGSYPRETFNPNSLSATAGRATEAQLKQFAMSGSLGGAGGAGKTSDAGKATAAAKRQGMTEGTIWQGSTQYTVKGGKATQTGSGSNSGFSQSSGGFFSK